MIDTSEVSGRMAFSRTSRSTMPFCCTGRYVMSKPSSPNLRHESRTHLCSCKENEPQRDSKTVDMHRLGCNDMFLLLLVEPSNSLDDHVVRLRGTRGENDVLLIGSDEVRDFLKTNIKKLTNKIPEPKRTCRACSTACSASQPYACVRLWGFPYWSVMNGNMASRTRGSVGVVAYHVLLSLAFFVPARTSHKPACPDR